uniref:Uncharacterized protein n=1 Tax=Knipowitschia caucasica TaxID=637954 RepID=A0AAV2MM85_KNICA
MWSLDGDGQLSEAQRKRGHSVLAPLGLGSSRVAAEEGRLAPRVDHYQATFKRIQALIMLAARLTCWRAELKANGGYVGVHGEGRREEPGAKGWVKGLATVSSLRLGFTTKLRLKSEAVPTLGLPRARKELPTLLPSHGDSGRHSELPSERQFSELFKRYNGSPSTQSQKVHCS